MNPTTPPPPNVLLVHNGSSYDAHVEHLRDAGRRVSETHAETAVSEALRRQPDIVVLDFGCDGEVTAALKGTEGTKDIPVIALVSLMPAH